MSIGLKKRAPFFIAAISAGAIAAIAASRMSVERREELSRLPGAVMGWMMEHMPDE